MDSFIEAQKSDNFGLQVLHKPSGDGTLRCLDLPPEIAKNLLENINRHPNDDRIRFEEASHVYWIDGDSLNWISSTTYIHHFFDEFDEEKIINMILKGRRWKNDPTYKYYQMLKKEISDGWEKNRVEASEAGTKLHADIEYFYNNLPVSNTSVEWGMFKEFFNDHKDLKMFRTEWMIFAEPLRITGSIDAVFKKDDGTLVLGDWKRSKEIRKTGFRGKKGKYPFKHLEDCNFAHYSLQLNLYRSILETFYDEVISEMFLVVLHPDQPLHNGKRYHKLIVPRLETEGKALFDFRKNQLIEMGIYDYSFNYKYNTAHDLGLPTDNSTSGNNSCIDESDSDDNNSETTVYQSNTKQKHVILCESDSDSDNEYNKPSISNHVNYSEKTKINNFLDESDSE